MITGALLAQSRLFGSSLPVEQLRPFKDIEARHIEGCSYRSNITRQFLLLIHFHE
jgi:hypothetical protein